MGRRTLGLQKRLQGVSVVAGGRIIEPSKKSRRTLVRGTKQKLALWFPTMWGAMNGQKLSFPTPVGRGPLGRVFSDGEES